MDQNKRATGYINLQGSDGTDKCTKVRGWQPFILNAAETYIGMRDE
jgi:hypothetical protein